MKLYLDTTHFIRVGLLNKQREWLDYRSIDSNTSSEVLHNLIYEMLELHKLKLRRDIEEIIYCAGPGSYTGMRISDGLAKIAHWSKMEVTNFYHFHVPQIFSPAPYRWTAKAFKGELFVYEKNEENHLDHSYLIPLEREQLLLSDKEYQYFNLFDSQRLVREYPQNFFALIENYKNGINDLFYFRSLDQEFSKKK